MTILRYIQAILLAFITALPLASCAKEPQLMGLTGVVYNYSQETLIFVEINGKQAGRGIDEAKLGEVTGGGRMCCIQLSPAWSSVPVNITDADGKRHTVTAIIERPWPELAHYAVVHILPGRKIVIETRPSGVWPRMDLLESRIKELRGGINK